MIQCAAWPSHRCVDAAACCTLTAYSEICAAEARDGISHAGTLPAIQERLTYHQQFKPLFIRAARALVHRSGSPGVPGSLQPRDGAALAVGCTSGKHRSVAFALILGAALTDRFNNLVIDMHHANIQAWPFACREGLCTECQQLPLSLLRCVIWAEELLDRI